MSRPQRHTIIEKGQVKAVALLFALLLFLGAGKAFQTKVGPAPERAAIAYKVHTQACQAALMNAGPYDIRSFPKGNAGGPVLSCISNELHLTILTRQETRAFVFMPKVKRYILFSCQRMGDPPNSIA